MWIQILFSITGTKHSHIVWHTIASHFDHERGMHNLLSRLIYETFACSVELDTVTWRYLGMYKQLPEWQCNQTWWPTYGGTRSRLKSGDKASSLAYRAWISRMFGGQQRLALIFTVSYENEIGIWATRQCVITWSKDRLSQVIHTGCNDWIRLPVGI